MPVIPVLRSTPKTGYLSENRKLRASVYNSTQWRKLRSAKLLESPICEHCGEAVAEDVHHVDSFMNYKNDPLLLSQVAFDPSNLQALCRTCHNLKHNETK